MTFKEWYAKEYRKSKSLDSLRLEIRATAAWNAAIKECADIAVKHTGHHLAGHHCPRSIVEEIRKAK